MIYIAFLFFTIIILIFVFYQWQYFMVFTPTVRRGGLLCDNCGFLSIVTDDKIELEGAIYEPKNPRVTLLVFVGRSHDSVGLMSKLSCNYPDVRVISFNYRSYGNSKGVANEKNLLKDSLKIAELVQKNYGSFYTLGFSLGSNIASFMASKHPTNGLFLVGAFDSIASLAKTKFVDKSFFPMLNLSKVFRYKFPTSKYVNSIEASAWLFVSTDDETTYIQNARALRDKVQNLAGYYELENLSHKELLWDDEVILKINEVLHDKSTF